jgi:hypothetical protein
MFTFGFDETSIRYISGVWKGPEYSGGDFFVKDQRGYDIIAKSTAEPFTS